MEEDDAGGEKEKERKGMEMEMERIDFRDTKLSAAPSSRLELFLPRRQKLQRLDRLQLGTSPPSTFGSSGFRRLSQSASSEKQRLRFSA